MESAELDYRRAVFVYEAAREFAMAAKAPVVPRRWVEREDEFRENFVRAVARQFTLDAFLDEEQLHNSWMEDYQAMGWTFGEQYDPKEKKHPDLLPFDQLHPREQDKDAVFLRLCEVAYNYIRE